MPMAMFLAPRYGAARVMLALSIDAAMIMPLAVLAGGAGELLLIGFGVAAFVFALL